MRLLIIFLAFMMYSCAQHKKITISPLPSYMSYKSNIHRIAINSSRFLTKTKKRKLLKKLRKCKGITRVKFLPKLEPIELNLAISNPVNAGKVIKSLKIPKGVDTVLLIHTKVETKGTTDIYRVIRFKDSKSHKIYDSYASPSLAGYGLIGDKEVAPDFEASGETKDFKTDRSIFKVTYLFFDKRAGKVLFQDSFSTYIENSFYSKKPALKAEYLEEIVYDQYLSQITNMICKKDEEVERNLYYMAGETPTANKMNEGVDYALDGMWEKAVNNFRGILKKDERNALALHNLGVYFELIGASDKAADYYLKSLSGKGGASLSNKVYLKLIKNNLDYGRVLDKQPIVEAISRGLG